MRLNRSYKVIRLSKKVLILTAVSFLILFAVVLIIRFASRPTPERPESDNVMGIPVTYEYISEGSGGRPGISRKIRYVVIHETANHREGANAEAHSQYLLNGGDGSTSWHYTVDDSEIYHHVPDSEVAWHAGDGLKNPGGNLNGIGIELCVNDDGDFEKTFDNGARLTAFLLNEYSLGTEDVKQHYDFNEKNCPMIIRETGRWQEFLSLTEKYLTELREEDESLKAD